MEVNMLPTKQKSLTNLAEASGFAPVRIVEVEIGRLLPTISAWDDKKGHCYRRALVLVRLHTRPLGTVELEFDEDGMHAAELAQHIWHTLGAQINEHLRQEDLPAV